MHHQFKSRLSAAHKKLLTSSNFSGYFSSKKLAGKIPVDETESPEKLKTTNSILNALGDMYIKSNPIQGNTYSGEISMDTPSAYPNALKYLFTILEDLSK